VELSRDGGLAVVASSDMQGGTRHLIVNLIDYRYDLSSVIIHCDVATTTSQCLVTEHAMYDNNDDDNNNNWLISRLRGWLPSVKPQLQL